MTVTSILIALQCHLTNELASPWHDIQNQGETIKTQQLGTAIEMFAFKRESLRITGKVHY